MFHNNKGSEELWHNFFSPTSLVVHINIIATNKTMALLTKQLWQDSYSWPFFNLQSQHRIKGSEKNFRHKFFSLASKNCIVFQKTLTNNWLKNSMQQWPSPILHNNTINSLFLMGEICTSRNEVNPTLVSICFSSM